MQLRFDNFTLDIEGGTLHGPRGHIPLARRPFDLLCTLASACGRVVDKERAIETVWSGRAISDAAFATALKSVRQALGDDGQTQRLLETVKGRGVRLAVPIMTSADANPEPAANGQITTRPGHAPRIAFLKFAHEEDPDCPLQESLPGDLISGLSRLRDLQVISRSSSFQFASGKTPARALRSAVGADYVMSGFVRGPRGARKIDLELCNTRDDIVVCTTRIDGKNDGDDEVSLAVRRPVIPVISREIARNASTYAGQKPTESLDAWEAYHLGITALFRNTAEGTLQALDHFRKAVEVDPRFASAHAFLSRAAWGNALNHYSMNREELIDTAIEAAEIAIGLDQDNPDACFAKGQSYWMKKAPTDGLPWFDRVLAINPNSSQGAYTRGVLNNLRGDPEAAQRDLALAMKISPIDPMIYSMRGQFALACLQQERFEEGLEWAEHAVRSPKSEDMVMFVAAAAAVLARQPDRARGWKAALAQAAPHITASRFFDSMPMQKPAQDLLTRAFDAIS